MTTDDPFLDRARGLQLDALLHEAAGVLPAPGLADRILDAIHTAPAPVLQLGRRHAWLAAAVVLLGLGVVGGVAWLRHSGAGGAGGGEPSAIVPLQDPTDQEPVDQGPGKQEPKKQEPKVITTLIADYSDNRIVEVDRNGKEVFVLDDVFGAWDVEGLANGNLLITEFSVSRVQEVTRNGKAVWVYEGLKNPYDADMLPNGNVLIADTFGGRVIEVKPDRESGRGGEIVWSYGDGVGRDIRPFDVDRLANGNTLIADVISDSALEVDPNGKVVWQAECLPNIHDADRLPNGNTLVTLRNKGEVREIDKAGKTVWTLRGLSSPSDADRLPNGNTIIAENTQVREFDQDGVELWRKATSWAVEVNRYVR
ncbi:MAG: hypothetical protein KDC98_16595 [Planctomycetes bacterium]|nr:hypothetical protein [Planctomycetota bacterium]